jgi:hypothetical protein
MPLSHLPDFLTTAFAALTHWLDKRSAARLPLLLLGILFAKGRRTITSWLCTTCGNSCHFEDGNR